MFKQAPAISLFGGFEPVWLLLSDISDGPPVVERRLSIDSP